MLGATMPAINRPVPPLAPPLAELVGPLLRGFVAHRGISRSSTQL